MNQNITLKASALSSVSCTGQFFVSVLNYSRTDVGCCPDTNSSNGEPCLEDCQLLFNIEVQGLNGSSKSSKRLSEDPINLSQAKSFQGMPNPIAFMFNKWPGELNVTMTVLHMSPLYAVGGSGMVVDTFHTYINFSGESTFYFPLSIGHGGEMNNESMVTIVYRYGCNPTQGPTCFSDCVDHDKSEKCPMTTPRPNGPTIVLNFTILTPTPPTGTHKTTSEGFQTTTTTETLTNSTSMQQKDTITTSRQYLDSGATPTPLSTKDNLNNTSLQNSSTFSTTTVAALSTESTISSTAPYSATTTKASTSHPKSTTTTATTEKASSTKSPIISAEHKDTTPTPTNGITTPSERYKYIDEKMTYWPVIVGCVLGGIALFAAAGYFVYWNRQKKMRKRQEIYNVNPKILRNFEEYEENGTSGRADVPLETEQY